MFVTTKSLKLLKFDKKNMRARKKCLKIVRKELKKALPAFNVKAVTDGWDEMTYRKEFARLFNDIVKGYNSGSEPFWMDLKMSDTGLVELQAAITPIY